MLEIELRFPGKDTSEWQNRLSALAHLVNVSTNGHRTHELMAEIDTTKNDAMVQAVEQTIKPESSRVQNINNIIFERPERIARIRQNRATAFRLLRHH